MNNTNRRTPPDLWNRTWDWIATRWVLLLVIFVIAFGLVSWILSFTGVLSQEDEPQPARRDDPSCQHIGPASDGYIDMLDYMERCPDSYQLARDIQTRRWRQ